MRLWDRGSHRRSDILLSVYGGRVRGLRTRCRVPQRLPVDGPPADGSGRHADRFGCAMAGKPHRPQRQLVTPRALSTINCPPGSEVRDGVEHGPSSAQISHVCRLMSWEAQSASVGNDRFRPVADMILANQTMPRVYRANGRAKMNKRVLPALALVMIVDGCADRKPPFSQEQFLQAKLQCGATDAYTVKELPNAIGFHGTSEKHVGQARCLKAKLADTDARVVVLGSQLYIANAPTK